MFCGVGGVLLFFEISSFTAGSLSWSSRSGMSWHSSLCEEQAVSSPEQDGAPVGPQQGRAGAPGARVRTWAEQFLFCHVAVPVQMDTPG